MKMFMKMVYQYMVILFNFSLTSNHPYSLQVENKNGATHQNNEDLSLFCFHMYFVHLPDIYDKKKKKKTKKKKKKKKKKKEEEEEGKRRRRRRR